MARHLQRNRVWTGNMPPMSDEELQERVVARLEQLGNVEEAEDVLSKLEVLAWTAENT